LSEGADYEAVEASLVAYLVKFAARLHRRGISPERLAGRLLELNTLSERLDGGVLLRAIN
jgi:hypothetical protein